MRQIEYRNVLKPSIEYLERCGTLMIDTMGMGEFLGVPSKVVAQLVYTDRIPLPCRLAEAGTSVFVVSTFDTDYLLVKADDLVRATAALRAAGHTVF